MDWEVGTLANFWRIFRKGLATERIGLGFASIELEGAPVAKESHKWLPEEWLTVGFWATASKRYLKPLNLGLCSTTKTATEPNTLNLKKYPTCPV